MDEVLKKCLESAKRINPGVKFIEADDYGDYYLFSYRIKNDYTCAHLAINKNTFSKKEDWQSADIFLDTLYEEIKL